MKKQFYTPLVLLAISATLVSCSDDDTEPVTPASSYPATLYMVNEGNFNAGDGRVSYYRSNGTDAQTEDDLFDKVNGRLLGDVVQSLSFHEGKGYIVVNNSAKLEIVDEQSFSSVATLSNLGSPRHFMGVSATKGYVTDWASNSVKIVDLSTNTVSGTIATATGPDRMFLKGEQLFVSNTGGFSVDSSLTIINTQTDAVAGSVQVGLMPGTMQLAANNKLWVICGGKYDDYFTPGVDEERAGELVRVDLATNQMDVRIPFQKTDHPQALAMSPDGNFLYFNLFNKVYKMPVTAIALPSAPLMELSGANIYGLSVNPANGDLLIADAPFNGNGRVLVYTSDGQKKTTLPSGGSFTNYVVVR